MKTITESVLIHRPVEHVFAFVSHYGNDPLWRCGVVEMKQAEPTRSGVTTKETLSVAGRQVTTIGLVTDVVPNEQVSFKSISGAFPLSGFRKVVHNGGGTLFTYSLSIQLSGLYRVFGLFFFRSFRRRVLGDLERLKAVLEANCISPCNGSPAIRGMAG